MKNIKLSLIILLLNILLIAGKASAATLTPIGTRPTAENIMQVELSGDEVTGIIAYDITVTGTDLSIGISDVSNVGSIAANWLVYNVSAVTGGVRIIAATSAGGGTTGAGSLGKVMFTAPDGCAGDNEDVAVIVNAASIPIAPAKFSKLPACCSTWDDVLVKYKGFMENAKPWNDVINCFTNYMAERQ